MNALRTTPPCALGLAVLAAACSPGPSAPAPPRAIVLIVVDTLRKDHLGCYGYEKDTSPNLDRLAAESVRYDRAVSQAPWTTPSIAALMTSQYPSPLGITTERSVLGEERLMLAEVLKAAGYATGAAVSHNFCSEDWGFAQGFDSFDDSMAGVGISSPDITAEGIEFIEANRDRPFFLWLHYFDPHWAYISHRDHPFEEEGAPPYEGPVWSGMDMREIKELAAKDELSEADLREVVRFYDSEIAFTDEHVGKVLDRLRDLGLFEDSLIVFTADHGEEFAGRGRLGHSGSLYGEVTGLPLLIHYPGEGPSVVDAPVGNVDVFPTILSRLDLPAPEGLVGSPLWPLDRPLDHAVFSETNRGAELRSVVRGRWKLIKDLKSGRYELYDLDRDPGERQDLWSTHSEEVASLRAELDDWIESIAAAESASRRGVLTEEQEEHLRSIGYTGG